MSSNTAREVDKYARVVAATVGGQDRRAARLSEEGLDEKSAAQLKTRVEEMMKGPESRTWTERFSVAYRAALKGKEPPAFEDPREAETVPEHELAPALRETELPSAQAPASSTLGSATFPAVAAPGDATLPLDRPHAVAVKPYVPFSTPADDTLSFEAFAAYQADMAVWPERAPEIFTRYGLVDPHKRKAVHATWAARLKEPILLMRWEAVVEQMVTAKKKQRDTLR
jgi:hypothetical protein